MIRHVAIIGAGFSGTLQAINLLRHDGPRATLIERATPGEGLAYGAAHPSHLLNVRAGGMSAFPDDPGHFVRWLAARGVADAAGSFAPRLTYGAYLCELLDAAVAQSAGRLTILPGEVVDLDRAQGGVRLTLANGDALAADAAVLAVGNLPSHDPAGLDAATLPPPRYFGNPWDPRIAAGLDDDDTVLIVGTGLTMVDVALSLEASGFGGRIIALSRRGLLPRRHAGGAADWDRIEERPAAEASALVHEIRARADTVGWRSAVDELRPFTQSMWRNATPTQRRRFIRHLRPWWDVHRHRLAPPVADRIEGLLAGGRLTVVAGKTIAFRAVPDAVALTWRRRGQAAAETIAVARVINCTGPLGDLARAEEPLLRRLVARGLIRPDSAHLGIDVDSEARTIAADSTSNDDLFALGPMTRGAFWEIVAVPDIRALTWTLVRRLSNAQWVGGEGL
ncbi:FAD-dependent oxidoreductase [Sphingomonas koreensis]|nr:FAD-dependent oxidoreductase [Sphingomonas koreensis]